MDELIYYYFNNPHSGLQHELTCFVEGDHCPPEVRLHGVENLLHRATVGGNITVVSELLKVNKLYKYNAHDQIVMSLYHLCFNWFSDMHLI